jgi:NAD(P)-dependent dehydrogenase (short-subunit alcohol dehydrogenase family)
MSNEVVIVTGASSGIGRATALAYSARGAHLVLLARGRDLLDEAATACLRAGAGSATAVVADVLDEPAVNGAVSGAVERFGRVDVVVHAAMVMAYGTIEQLPLAVIDRVMATATLGTVRVARAALRAFRVEGRGSLVIVTSLLGSVAVPGIGAYVTGKWAQVGLSRVLQLETADAPDIRVHTVSPGAVDTPIYRRAANIEGHPGAPPPPVARPEKVAAAIVRAVDRGRGRVSVGWLNQVVVFGFRFSAPVYSRLVGPLYKRFALERRTIVATDGNVFTGSVAEPAIPPHQVVSDVMAPAGRDREPERPE